MTNAQTQAMISEIEQQRNWALTRCATLAAAVTALNAEVEKLKAAQAAPAEDVTSDA